MSSPPEVLSLTTEMPERHLEPGEVLFDQHELSPVVVAVLVDGHLEVRMGDAVIGGIDQPGAFVGEIGALLGDARTATVAATTPATVRIIGDPDAFFATHPQLALELARQLAGRLHRMLAYLGDLREQYSDAEGHLTMVDSVLGRLASRAPVEIDPGSDRSPDY
jgi:CRP-like cAMP-binding protein